ncbi:hypothetical protein O181_033560 [Austropuccinia psidii MF-1]|uniref:Secreted protein n=1 Tax=Austropuccinia psidii MF-1 TaxID=1389203 RepID=A0A9Q3D1G6_9BASI|nr:hypothetical protein [Austropuccinia psidii MF-1]
MISLMLGGLSARLYISCWLVSQADCSEKRSFTLTRSPCLPIPASFLRLLFRCVTGCLDYTVHPGNSPAFDTLSSFDLEESHSVTVPRRNSWLVLSIDSIRLGLGRPLLLHSRRRLTTFRHRARNYCHYLLGSYKTSSIAYPPTLINQSNFSRFVSPDFGAQFTPKFTLFANLTKALISSLLSNLCSTTRPVVALLPVRSSFSLQASIIPNLSRGFCSSLSIDTVNLIDSNLIS